MFKKELVLHIYISFSCTIKTRYTEITEDLEENHLPLFELHTSHGFSISEIKLNKI